MAVDWYYVRDDQQVGPVSSAELKRLADTGELVPTDMVSKKGLGKWVPASSIKGLCENATDRVPAARVSNEVLFADGEVTITSSTLTIGSNQFEVWRLQAADVTPLIKGNSRGAAVAFCMACYCFIVSFAMGGAGLVACASNAVSADPDVPIISSVERNLIFVAVSLIPYVCGRLLLRPARNLWRQKKGGEYQLRVATDSGVHVCMVGIDVPLLERIAQRINEHVGRAGGPVLHTGEPEWIHFVRTRVPFLFRD